MKVLWALKEDEEDDGESKQGELGEVNPRENVRWKAVERRRAWGLRAVAHRIGQRQLLKPAGPGDHAVTDEHERHTRHVDAVRLL